MDCNCLAHDEKYWKKKNWLIVIILVFQVLFGLHKTLIFNLYYFGVRGLRFPVLCSANMKITKLKGKVIVPQGAKTGSIKLGFSNSEMFLYERRYLNWINDGIVEFKGKVGMHSGVIIRNYGYLCFGDNFHISSPSSIVCYKEIIFGKDVLIGWNCEFMDGDAHKIYDQNNINRIAINENKAINIGNHVWIASGVKVLKGTSVGDNSVVASNSLLTKSYNEDNVVIAGSPAKIIKKEINWLI